jgi:hypothetical protein
VIHNLYGLLKSYSQITGKKPSRTDKEGEGEKRKKKRNERGNKKEGKKEN